jgi:hypothetical protein
VRPASGVGRAVGLTFLVGAAVTTIAGLVMADRITSCASEGGTEDECGDQSQRELAVGLVGGGVVSGLLAMGILIASDSSAKVAPLSPATAAPARIARANSASGVPFRLAF